MSHTRILLLETDLRRQWYGQNSLGRALYRSCLFPKGQVYINGRRADPVARQADRSNATVYQHSLPLN